MKHDNRSFARCFYLEFWHEYAKPNVRRVYVQGEPSEKEVCRSFGHRKHLAINRYRSYRLVLSLRSHYRQKTNNLLPPRNYRRMALPPKMYCHILVLPPPPKSLPPKNEKPPTAEKLPPYFGFTASAKVATAKKRKTTYRRKITAVWHYRPACVRL